MSDLISRKALIDDISYKFVLGDSIISNVLGEIKKQPTAYDLESVIRKLREIQLESSSSEFDYGIDKAIEIIKSGTTATNGKNGG